MTSWHPELFSFRVPFSPPWHHETQEQQRWLTPEPKLGPSLPSSSRPAEGPALWMARLVLPAGTTCRDLVSPSVTWALGIELRFCPEDGKHLSLMNLLPTRPHP